MDNSLKKRLKLMEKKSKNVQSNIKRKIYPKYEKCPECHGTLYKEDGSPCKCKTDYILSIELKKCNVGENFLNVSLGFYDKYFSDAIIKIQKGLNGKKLKKTFSIDYFTKYLKLYAETFMNRLNDGRGFILSGDCGGGKTSAVIWIMRQLCLLNYRNQFNSDINIEKRHINMLFIDTIEMLDLIKDTWDSDSPTKYESKKKLDMMSKVHLLVIDDLGAEYTKSMDWLLSIFLKIIKGRSNKNLPTLITTNFTPEQLSLRFEEKEFARLASVLTEKFEVIIIDNPVDVRSIIADETDLLDIMSKEVKPNEH